MKTYNDGIADALALVGQLAAHEPAEEPASGELRDIVIGRAGVLAQLRARLLRLRTNGEEIE